MKASVLIMISAALSATVVSAQDAKNFTYQSSSHPTRQTAEEIEDIGELDESSAGIFARSKFRAGASAREEFTTNARLTGSHSSDDFIFLPTVTLGYNTALGKHFHFDIEGRVESAIYSRFDKQSFYGLSALTTLDYRPEPKLPRIYIGAEPYRYLSYDTGSRITQAVGLTVGTDWGFAFDSGHSLAYIGYNFTNFYSDPGVDDREQHTIVLGVTHTFSAKLTGQLYYSWQYSDFNIDRRDSRNVVGANLIYQFNKHWFGSITTSYINNSSSVGAATYDGFGASVGLNYQF